MGRPAADLCKGQQSASSFLDPKLQRLIKDIQLKRSSLIGKNHVKPLMTNTSNYNFRELGLEAFNLRAEFYPSNWEMKKFQLRGDGGILLSQSMRRCC